MVGQGGEATRAPTGEQVALREAATREERAGILAAAPGQPHREPMRGFPTNGGHTECEAAAAQDALPNASSGRATFVLCGVTRD